MGGAQPRAATMAGASALVVECQPEKIKFRLRTGYLDKSAETLDEALAILDNVGVEPVSVGLLRNAADVYAEVLRRGLKPDNVTDQTAAHDPINGYLPHGWTVGTMGNTTPKRSTGRCGSGETEHGTAGENDVSVQRTWLGCVCVWE